ncbi:hypothetical protein P170DRAFT_441804 [Aspergillus steynii IBT 23096]|uniref:Lincomycin-condensing protein lmbA n=1 Tax=Aspergillus steynii IBT 23096 TaxID=1392250 RepID=A0A2I2FRZ6_9EURO|nr:uncharacterized protein P170DRAFT_441804 [Aspergillus steynii IBT 23096]PLB43405.1 hypothetical protein P170DRAFT_441804 [Aspergillus steynii IBT 23096]
MSIISTLFPCLSARRKSTTTTTSYNTPESNDPSLATHATTILLTTEDPSLIPKHLSNLVSTTGWTSSLAQTLLQSLETAIQSGAKTAKPATDALSRAKAEAYDFATDHPVYTTVLALGVLVILAPWVLEVLGFGELGPLEGSFAAWWQRLYAGYVPRGSLFSFFQRLGMVWRF